MAKLQPAPPLWKGTVTVTIEIEVGSIPAKDARHAERLIKAVAEESLRADRSIKLWLHKDGSYQPFGRGKPSLHIKHPDIMLGIPEGEVDDVDEEDRYTWLKR